MNNLNPQSMSLMPIPEHHAHQHRPRLAVDAPHQMVRAMDALADNHIVLGNIGGEARDFLRIELPVAIREHDIRLRRGTNAGNHRAAIAAILLVMHDFDVRVLIARAHPQSHRSASMLPSSTTMTSYASATCGGFIEVAARDAFDVRLFIM